MLLRLLVGLVASGKLIIARGDERGGLPVLAQGVGEEGPVNEHVLGGTSCSNQGSMSLLEECGEVCPPWRPHSAHASALSYWKGRNAEGACEDMQKAGVPLDIPRSEGSHVRSARPDSAYTMRKVCRFLRDHPQCSVADREAGQKRLYRVRAGMGDAGKQAFMDSHGHAAATETVASLLEERPPDLESIMFAPSWELGGEEWPVYEKSYRVLQTQVPRIWQGRAGQQDAGFSVGLPAYVVGQGLELDSRE